MKGLIFNLVEEAVSGTYGEQMWDQLLEGAALDGAYTSMGDYPDSDLQALVAAGCVRTGMAPEDLVRALGRASFAGLARRSPHSLARYESVLDLLAAVEGIIHPEVLKIYPNAEPPRFAVHRTAAGRAEVEYDSRRGLCALAEGLTLGAADHFGESVTVVQPECLQRGDERCLLVVTVDG